MRLFIAAGVNEDIREQARYIQEQLNQARAHIKWVDPDSCHLSLKFIGNVTEDQLQSIANGCERAAEQHIPFHLVFQGLGAFPHVRNMRVLWMGMADGADQLMALQQSVEEQIEPLGFPAESRAFEPHLTLGRVKVPLSRAQMLFFKQVVDAYEGFTLGTVPVESIHLMRSVLRSTGPEYTILESFLLGAVRQLGPGTMSDFAPADLPDAMQLSEPADLAEAAGVPAPNDGFAEVPVASDQELADPAVLSEKPEA